MERYWQAILRVGHSPIFFISVAYLAILASIIVARVFEFKDVSSILRNYNSIFMAVVVSCYMFARLGKRGAIFAALAFSVTLAAETSSVLYGIPFGKYYYSDEIPFHFLGLVPLLIPMAWVPLTFAAYSTTNEIARAFGILHGKVAAPVLAALDGACLVTFDFFAEPMKTNLGLWVWVDSGPYFGIPISNYIGWFIVTFVVTLLFRAIGGAGHREQTPIEIHAFDVKLSLGSNIPTICLALQITGFAAEAVLMGYALHAVISVALVMPFVAIALSNGTPAEGLVKSLLK